MQRVVGILTSAVSLMAAGLFVWPDGTSAASSDCCSDILDVWQAPPIWYGPAGPRGSRDYAVVDQSLCKSLPAIHCDVQKAIDQVRPGGLVQIYGEESAPYLGNLQIDKPITLRGNYDPFADTGARLNAPDGARPCVFVKVPADRGPVVIEGLKIVAQSPYGSYPCLDVDAPNFTLKGSAVEGQTNMDTIVVRSGNASISRSRIEKGRTGIAVVGFYGSAPVATAGSRVAAAGPLVPRPSASKLPDFVGGRLELTDNAIFGGEVGLYIANGATVRAFGNEIYGNSRAGVVFQNVSAPSGSYTPGTLTGNGIFDNGDGIVFFEGSASPSPDITANDIANRRVGVRVLYDRMDLDRSIARGIYDRLLGANCFSKHEQASIEVAETFGKKRYASRKKSSDTSCALNGTTTPGTP